MIRARTAAAAAPYDVAFYRALDLTAGTSARRILPLLLDLVPARSIVDAGCGDGSWLAAARDCGVNDILGLDGPWIDASLLRIPADRFRRVQLDRPLALDRRFDLAMSLEVAEHLPSPCAAGFVGELVRLAPVVLFSAAIPGQGGPHHVNEQWPEYWAALFGVHGYRAIDALRWRVWGDPEITYWYKQNMLLFAAPAALAAYPALADAAAVSTGAPLALVHPEVYGRAQKAARPGFRRWLAMGPQALRQSMQRRWSPRRRSPGLG
jgi:SAM-dependent methyltransferase